MFKFPLAYMVKDVDPALKTAERVTSHSTLVRWHYHYIEAAMVAGYGGPHYPVVIRVLETR